MSEGETKAPGPALAMISKRSSSKAELRTIGRTEALVNCMAKRLASSSETWVGVVRVSLVEFIFEQGLEYTRLKKVVVFIEKQRMVFLWRDEHAKGQYIMI